MMMSEPLNIDTEDVYEAPMLAEVGRFAALTQGAVGEKNEAGFGKYDD
jgi:hypothetical protein